MPVGGALKLKGGEALKPAGGVKKKKKNKEEEKSPATALTRVDSKEGDVADKTDEKEDLKKILHGYSLEGKEDELVDKRTEAEKRFDRAQLKLEQDRLKKLAAKSHRDRVKDFNEHLAKLSEHHDIPRVGPG